jgi:hypothetical protein
MPISDRPRSQDARQRAADHFTKEKSRESNFIKERKREQELNAEKTLRLRTLRLAKEALEREAAAKKALESPPKIRKPKAVKIKGPPERMISEAELDEAK